MLPQPSRVLFSSNVLEVAVVLPIPNANGAAAIPAMVSCLLLVIDLNLDLHVLEAFIAFKAFSAASFISSLVGFGGQESPELIYLILNIFLIK